MMSEMNQTAHQTVLTSCAQDRQELCIDLEKQDIKEQDLGTFLELPKRETTGNDNAAAALPTYSDVESQKSPPPTAYTPQKEKEKSSPPAVTPTSTSTSTDLEAGSTIYMDHTPRSPNSGKLILLWYLLAFLQVPFRTIFGGIYIAFYSPCALCDIWLARYSWDVAVLVGLSALTLHILRKSRDRVQRALMAYTWVMLVVLAGLDVAEDMSRCKRDRC